MMKKQRLLLAITFTLLFTLSLVNCVQAAASKTVQKMVLLAGTTDANHSCLMNTINQLSPITLTLICGLLLLLIVLPWLRSWSKKRELQQLKNTDTLTGLPTRTFFLAQAQKILRANPHQKYAILYMDIKSFKYINETYGYDEGNLLLQDVAAMLRAFIHTGELAARNFADDFILLLQYEAKEELLARIKASDILMRLPLHDREKDYHLILNSGLYFIEANDTGENLPNYLVHAHYAMDTAQGLYHNNLAIYSDEIRQKIMHERELERTMEAALDNGEFVPYYQAKVNIETHEIVGAEALSRWITPEKGIRNPAEFIPFFEECTFITRLDFYIFEEVCKQMSQWLEEKRDVPRISCNFSKLHLKDKNFVSNVVHITKKYHLPPHLVELELTESAAETISEDAKARIASLRALGYSIAIDDFGTGFSSLALLDQIEVDVLKLDKQFFEQKQISPRWVNILHRLVQMAGDMGIEIVCEGVQTKEQENFLRSLGCFVMQSFHYAKPISADDFRNQLNTIEK